MRKKIAFIGVGNMANAIISGVTSREESPMSFNDIVLFDRNTEKMSALADRGTNIVGSIAEAVGESDCVVLCVKPQNFPEVLVEMSACEEIESKLIVSIAAGITTETVEKALGNVSVVRVMPNTPMLIGKGVSALCRNRNVSDSDFDFACSIFSSSGDIILIREDEMNRIISVTGSSPAYVFLFIKAIYEGAVAQGLLRKEGEQCGICEKDLMDSICNTVIGAAELMKSGGKTPDEQINIVCSKGGTTERAISVLQDNDFCGTVVLAMEKCTERADELGRK